MAKDIENPCVSLCQLNSELCVSCGRTREEIRKWRGMKRPREDGLRAEGCSADEGDCQEEG